MVSIKCQSIKRLISKGFATKKFLNIFPYPKDIETVQRINKFYELENPLISNFKLPFSLLRERQGGIIYFFVWGIFLFFITLLELLFFKNNVHTFLTFATPWRILYRLTENQLLLPIDLVGFFSISAVYVRVMNRLFMIETICILLKSGKINKFYNPDEEIIRFKDPKTIHYIIGLLIMFIVSLPILILRNMVF